MLGGFNSIRMVRKGPFYEQFAPTLPVSAESAYQTTGIGVVSLGEVQGTGRVYMWSGWCPVLVDSNTRLHGQGASWQGKWHFRGSSAWQKLFLLYSWVLWMLAHLSGLTGKMTIWRDKCRFYCLQVANRLMYPVTTNIPINF